MLNSHNSRASWYMVIMIKNLISVICILFDNMFAGSRNSAYKLYPLKISFFLQFISFFYNISVYKESIRIVNLVSSIYVFIGKLEQMDRLLIHLNILIVQYILRKDAKWYLWFLWKLSFPVKQNISVVM